MKITVRHKSTTVVVETKDFIHGSTTVDVIKTTLNSIMEELNKNLLT